MPFNIGPGELVIVLIIGAVCVLPFVMIFRAGQLSRGSQVEPVAWATPSSIPAVPDPRVTLAERLAKGEISRDDFDTAMRALGYTDNAG